VRLRSQINPDCGVSSNLKFSDIYADGSVAVQGSYVCRGVFIYDISNPDAPVLASWYNPSTPGDPSIKYQFLEAIVIGNRGYFGSGTGGGGVHIVDLSNPYNPVLLGVVDATHGNGHNYIHEMVVFTQNGNPYLIENYNGISLTKILKIINVSDPANPVFVRDINPTEAQWVHAMHIRGNRLFTSGWGNGSNRGRTEIYDITNISTQAPTLLGYIEDPTSITAGNNMHSSWTSEDGNYLYSCRETNNGTGDVRVYNISDPAQPLLVNSLTMNGLNLNAITPHNPVVMGNKLYVSWYQAGLQVFDISDPVNPRRIGQYDTFQNAFAQTQNKSGLSDEPWDAICGISNLQNNLPTNYDGAWAVFPFLGEDKVLVGDLASGLYVLDVTRASNLAKNTASDFDGDGKTDLSVYTPVSGTWRIEQSSNSGFSTAQWGNSTDIVVPGDYDGDGKTDFAAWRPSSGIWYIYGSTSGVSIYQWGQSGDVPVEADYDADGRTDIAVWRPSNGTWYIYRSALGPQVIGWGAFGDKVFAGDFDGDGKPDFSAWRPADGTWYILSSASSLVSIAQWGTNGDKPLVADFDGDNKSDFAVYRPSNGTWYIANSGGDSVSIYTFGSAEDIPIPSDFDGDGKGDLAVFRPSSDVWYRLNSNGGAFIERAFGQLGDMPTPVSVQPQ
jgi:hypothetical protein